MDFPDRKKVKKAERKEEGCKLITKRKGDTITKEIVGKCSREQIQALRESNSIPEPPEDEA